MSSTKLPDYYALLDVHETATTEEIRTAYKKASLRSHPDRFASADARTKRQATERFQAIADAYYVLSDPTRRREYDAIRRTQKSSSAYTDDPGASANYFANFADFAHFFTSAAAGAGAASASASEAGTEEEERPRGPGERPDADTTFGTVFEELLRPEVQRVAPVWTWTGAAAGAVLGYIVANVPGALGGLYAGNRLGAIRDAKGKSVAAVFSSLPNSQRLEILKALAFKVLGSSAF